MFWQYVTKNWYSTAWNTKQQLAVYINLSFGIQFNLFWKSIQFENRIRGDYESWTSPMWNETYKHHLANLPPFRGWKPTPANVLALQHFSSLTCDGDSHYVSTFISIVGRQMGKLVCVCVCVFGICLLSPWERCPVSSGLGWFYRSDLPASPCRSASLKALHGRIRNGSNLSRREYCNQTEPNLLNRRWNRLEFNATIYIYGYALFCVPGRDKYTYIMRYAYLLKRCRSVWKLLDSEVYFTFHPDGVGVVWRTFGVVSKRMQLRNTIFCILLMVSQRMSCSWHRRNEVHSSYLFFDFRFIDIHSDSHL